MSQICSICRSSNFSTIDGRFFCDGCGTQSVRTYEIAAEAEIFNFRLNITKTLTQQKKTDKEVKVKTIKERREPKDVKFPQSLGITGRRIGLSATLIIRICRILISDFDVDFSVSDVCLHLFQKYLSKFGIAFSPAETTMEEEKRYKCIKKKTLKEIAAEKKKLIQLEKERLKEINATRKRKLKRWQREMEKDEERELEPTTNVEVSVIQQFETDLAIDSVKSASRIDLRINILLCIIYLGCNAIGAKKILFSDLLRWHREDRFDITANEIISLGIGTDADSQRPTKRCLRRNQSLLFSSGVESLSYSHRSLSMLIQIIGHSQLIVLPSFRLILNRLLFDLNLPKTIWNRALFILERLPMITTTVDHSLLYKTFPVIENIRDKINSPEKIGERTFNLYVDENYQSGLPETADNLVWIPNETKAAAILLLILEATFPMEEKLNITDDFSDTNAFIFTEWLQQLNMRNCMRLGHSASSVLSSAFVQKSLLDESNIHKRAIRVGEKFSYNDRPQLLAPPRAFVPQESKPLHSVFSTDRNPFVGHSATALYSPIRYQLECLDETNLDYTPIDAHRLRIFRKEFNHSEFGGDSSEYEDIEEIFPNLPNLKGFRPNDWKLFMKGGKFVIANSALCIFFDRNRKFFEPIFDQLLYELALSIGERADVLYFTYSIAEYCILRRLPTIDCQKKSKNESQFDSTSENSDDDDSTKSSFFDYVITRFW